MSCLGLHALAIVGGEIQNILFFSFPSTSRSPTFPLPPHLPQHVDVRSDPPYHGQLVQQLHLVLEGRVEKGRSDADQEQRQVASGYPGKYEIEQSTRFPDKKIGHSNLVSNLCFLTW